MLESSFWKRQGGERARCQHWRRQNLDDARLVQEDFDLLRGRSRSTFIFGAIDFAAGAGGLSLR